MGQRAADLVATTSAQGRSLVFPTHVRYAVLAVACSLAVLTYIQRQGFWGGAPYIREALGLNDSQMGELASIWLIAYGIFQVPGGLLGDRLGARHLLTLLVLVWSLLIGAVALTGLLPATAWWTFAFLLVLRFLFGAFQAGGFPALARVIADWMPSEQRGFAQGMVWTFSRLGGALAPLLIVVLFRSLGNWMMPFWVLAALGLVWCVVFWPWFRNRPEEHSQVNSAELLFIRGSRASIIPLNVDSPRSRPEPSTDIISGAQVDGIRSSVPDSPGPSFAAIPREPTSPKLPWWKWFASVNVWALCLMYGFVGFSGNFITSLLPDYLRHHRNLSMDTTAWLSGLPLAAGIVSCLLGGVVSDWLIVCTGSRKWGRRVVGCTVLLLAGLSAFSIIWVDEVWLLALSFSAMFFFNDATMGPAWASCADVGERYAGTLSGAMNMTGAFLGAIGMRLAGGLFDRKLDDVVFILFTCSYVLAALCWLAVDVTKPLVPRQASGAA